MSNGPAATNKPGISLELRTLLTSISDELDAIHGSLGKYLPEQDLSLALTRGERGDEAVAGVARILRGLAHQNAREIGEMLQTNSLAQYGEVYRELRGMLALGRVAPEGPVKALYAAELAGLGVLVGKLDEQGKRSGSRAA